MFIYRYLPDSLTLCPLRIVNGRKVTTKKVVENGVETVTTYEDDVIKSRTVNGVPQQMQVGTGGIFPLRVGVICHTHSKVPYLPVLTVLKIRCILARHRILIILKLFNLISFIHYRYGTVR